MDEVTPVLEGVESCGDALDPPLAILVGVKDKLDGRLHFELLLQGKQMLLPGAPTLGERKHLPTGIYLEVRREPENCVFKNGRNLQKQLQFSV